MMHRFMVQAFQDTPFSSRTVLYYDGSLKDFAFPTALVEMLSCRILSNVAVGIKHLYF